MKNFEEIEDWFDDIYDQIIDPISENENIHILDSSYERPKKKIEEAQKEHLKISHVVDFYSCTILWKLHWKTDEKLGFNIEGTFDFLPLERVLYNWDNEFGGNDWAPTMKGFRPLDMFYESAGCVGFFLNREDKAGMYLNKFSGEAHPLHINFDGYLRLLGLSKGFSWWQNAMIEISTGEHQPNVDNFKEKMPQIFPDFNYEKFKVLYESLRIR